MNLLVVLIVILLVLSLGSAPIWPHAASWGYFPSGGLGLLVLVLIVLLLAGRL